LSWHATKAVARGVEIERVMGAAEAYASIEAAHQDYDAMFGDT